MENTQRIERSRESCGDVLALDILSVLSILVSGVVVLYKGRQAKLRLFPNSFLLFNCAAACVTNISISISFVFQRRQLLPNSLNAICTLQAALFSFCSNLIFFNWLLSIVVLHGLVVRKMELETLNQYKNRYYAVCTTFVVSSSFLPLVLGNYGPTNGAGICYIKDDSTMYLLPIASYLVISGPLFFFYMLPVIRVLWSASQSASSARHMNIMRNFLFQHVVYAIYTFTITTAFVLTVLNEVIFYQINGGKESSYVAATFYTFCTIGNTILAMVGISNSIIFVFTYDHYLWIKSRIFPPKAMEDPFGHFSSNHSPSDYSSLPEMKKPPKPTQANFANSGFDTDANTAVSALNDSVAANAQAIYTQQVLDHVKQQLEMDYNLSTAEMSSFMSDFESNLSSMPSTKTSDMQEVIDARLAIARTKWMQNYNPA